jgi:[ribosomal protein S5]-alanine N-acetyltransferase
MAHRFRALRWPLRTGRLLVRPPGLADVDEIAAAISDPRIARATLNIPYPYRRADALRFIERSRRRRYAEESLSLILVGRKSGRILGGVSLFGFDWDRSKAEVGYWITPSEWGKGYAPEAVHRIARAAFRELKIHRLQAGTFEFNSASGRVLQKVGFVREGVARSDVRKGRRWHNTVVYSLLLCDLKRPETSRARGRPSR